MATVLQRFKLPTRLPPAPAIPPRSSVGKKAVMAVSGIVLIAFLIAHMVGNFHAFEGRESFNHYSHWLRTLGEPVLPGRGFLVIMEVTLLVAVVAHMASAVLLWRQAKLARPVAYQHTARVQQSYASRTVRWGGVIIALYVLWHLLDMTFGTVNPAGADATPYDKLVASFQNPLINAFYVLALVTLGFHLQHGIWSALATLGLSNHRREPLLKLGATVVSVALIGGFLLVPAAVAIGVVGY
jgi:succinate dehydrogenase / fumarate reductase cytochrome b subunit